MVTERQPLQLKGAEITAREMAKITGYSIGRINRLRKAGVIRTTMLGERRMVTLRSDFEAYWNGEQQGADVIDYGLLAEKVAPLLASELARRLAWQIIARP